MHVGQPQAERWKRPRNGSGHGRVAGREAGNGQGTCRDGRTVW